MDGPKEVGISYHSTASFFPFFQGHKLFCSTFIGVYICKQFLKEENKWSFSATFMLPGLTPFTNESQ
jgi:hypothetical protein